MFDHVTIRVSDRKASERFYDTVLSTIGIERTGTSEDLTEWDDFSLTQGDEPTTGLHIGFCAWSRAEVDHFWRTGIEAGYRSDGEPDLRPEYLDDYYGAFLLDPDGNSVEAVNHGNMVRLGNIDHLWIRVPELDMAQMFYELIAPFSGFELRRRLPERAHFRGLASTFSLVDDARPVTRNLHLAFGTDANATVDRFHAAATAAGYVDNGGPGERPEYHAGYYAAFVIDPAGANVEVVNHNRADVA